MFVIVMVKSREKKVVTRACKNGKHHLCNRRAIVKGNSVECLCKCHKEKRVISSQCLVGKHGKCKEKNCRCTCHLRKELRKKS